MKKYVNNRGFGENGNFDGLKNSFQCKELLQGEPIKIKNIPFQLHHTHQSYSYNDATARGQVITLPTLKNKNIGAIYLLASSNHGPVKTPLTITYQDGTTSTTTLDIPDWQVGYPQHIERLDVYSCQTNINQVDGLLFIVPLFVDPSKPVSHLTLPYTYPIGWFAPALHIFAITAYPINIYSSYLANIISVTPTTQYLNSDRREYQWVQVRIHNIHSHFLHNIHVSIESDMNNNNKKDGDIQVTTYKPGIINRLAPGHVRVVQVAISTSLHKNNIFIRDHSSLVTITSKSWLGIKKIIAQDIFSLDVGIKDYSDDYSSLSQHQTPNWLKQAKFGIFIHWGLYSVPSWGSVGRSYAEWYWWQLMQKNSPTYFYHKNTYGEQFEYDDFIDSWNTSTFDAYQWLDLIDASRAKYYVFTTKHHDGIALFDTKVTQRSTVHFKQQDFVRQLTEISKTSFPHLKRGLYFSLPEWYHPSYSDPGYGWHGPPRNAYNDTEIPYTASTPITDFVNELQVPQFFELIDNYDPDILWCDLNGINNSTVWQSKYFNQAREQGKQVAINDRCGNGISDFMTSEYQSLYNTPSRFWEATRGIDPYSFGYNHATLPEQYATTTDLIHELINVVANGGNFLLNIGPDSFGNVPIIMRERLIEMGEWLDKVSPSIFDSEPYWISVQDTSTPSQSIRFTIHRQGTSFYIFVLEKPITGRVIIKTPLPLHPNAIVRLLGDPLNSNLPWKIWNNGRFIIEVPDRILDILDHAWVFEIHYP